VEMTEDSREGAAPTGIGVSAGSSIVSDVLLWIAA
jgi:hypothetical protein